jgi:hypothetical protein
MTKLQNPRHLQVKPDPPFIMLDLYVFLSEGEFLTAAFGNSLEESAHVHPQ